ncbi:D-beta-D-heptose 1-phosphate adenosyltransferase [Cryobacterium roopkundense]|uniref:Lactose phosphotransferase system repressor n=1 Tax=Cryobacterium roopkundense TaxID=1001240 RepID=A0A099JJK6_9MICO|nr:DeoR/GlpR family DNA-binding transcription regulator [Cryobacterium roopkundense]KGJ78361.1 D-beta-D-heptose 1-phosphate adenosyltransferase [Cryobacterium roopkundense]MBB5640007.1 DeoR family fructose operon transcriptional repressor [Cryobacterium roopkundense]
MFAEERQLLIATLVSDRGRVTVSDLASRFNITSETVRRDLDTLETARQLRRVHGGAVAIDRMSMSEPSIQERQSQRLDQKTRIAEAALAMIPTSRTGSIILDAGTTTERLGDLLATWTPPAPGDQLLVITNALPIAWKLSNNTAIHLHVLGGRVRGLTSAIVGSSTIEQLSALRPDIAFIGANGINAQFGLSTPDSVEAAVKSAIVRAARRVVALADSSKLDEETLVCFAALADIDTLITDAAPSAELAAALAAADVEVVIA